MSTDQQIQNFLRYKHSPWDFLTECVFTRDAVDETNPVKQFPKHEYLRLFTMLWQKEKMMAVPKSRRMVMSWTCIALTVWECIFHKGKECAFVSKKEDDAAELVNRAWFIFTRIPPARIPKTLLPEIVGGKPTKSPPRLEFDFGDGTKSYIQGFPMGADQLRQFTFSRIFGDEAAFWEQAEEFYTGAQPTLLGGGAMVLVSSRSPGFFKRIVFDQINSKDSNVSEVPPAEIKRPLEGVEIWKNPKNRFLVVDLHYTADPAKRSTEFREGIKAALPTHQYLREFERNWQTFSGLPVYPNFRADIHCPSRKLEAHLGLPLLFGWDFGLSPACIVGQLQGNSLKILKEFTTQNEGIKTFSAKVMGEVQQLWPEWKDIYKDHIHFIDPAGLQRNQNDERTCAIEMEESAGIKNINPGPVNWEARRSAVEKYLLYIDKDGAGFEINESECPVLVQGFRGGYRYADNMSENNQDDLRPLKNMFSHPHDGLQYLAFGASQRLSQINITIPTPQYSFSPQHKTGVKNYGRKLASQR